MRPIDGEVFTYAEHPAKEWILREGSSLDSFGLDERRTVKKRGPTWATVKKIRAWPGYPVRSFRELVMIVAHLASGNRMHCLFFRGQSRDWRDRYDLTTMYPTICRPEPGNELLRKKTLVERVERVRRAQEILDAAKNALELRSRLHEHGEASLALLQHYEVCATPLIDVTQSLRVAASFALMENGKSGFVYALGLPHPNGSISHFVDHEIVIVRLQSVCPYRALRPHFQEGLLAGRYPWKATKEPGDNIASRLIAKLRIENRRGKFWDRGFPAMPRDALLPNEDPFGEELRAVLARAP